MLHGSVINSIFLVIQDMNIEDLYNQNYNIIM